MPTVQFLTDNPELADKLEHRGVPGVEIERVLDRLEAQGLLSEARFIEQFVVLRLRQDYGPFRIRGDFAAHIGRVFRGEIGERAGSRG